MIQRPKHLWGGYELRSAVVREKIEWADHHRELLQAAFKEFRSRRPYSITEDIRLDEGRTYRVLTAHPEPAPHEIGLIFSDFLQNIRASLDYLVGAMRADGPRRNSAFPSTSIAQMVPTASNSGPASTCRASPKKR